ncbi:hybrid sensor histidine kinase/response regulator [Leptolyngbya ohadii]|uniref:hybrid sensor histidine kinase/response regulator n=1 Tax=Leptolyngbya ohadii TaxID=1962290 RepID=UPI001CEE06C1|nr:ATP-binding protein [Leptolyngbya ohadii]
MSQDKELAIQLQFLDEAREYLMTLDEALIGIAHHGISADKINAALRSAHSIKGGAGMMGFTTLSQMAHRLEDSLKVLKIQRQTIAVDDELEGLLLTGVDCLRRVIDCDRQQIAPDAGWLNNEAMPIFEQLHDRLGDPENEDAQSILSPEDGHDIMPLLFETEVEGCLTRLETVLAENHPCLREELEILAQELGGLGEMLQLDSFTQLCGSIAIHIAAAPERIEEIAAIALQAWRRSQALVLIGQRGALPTEIEIPGLTEFLAETGLDSGWNFGQDTRLDSFASEFAEGFADSVTDSVTDSMSGTSFDGMVFEEVIDDADAVPLDDFTLDDPVFDFDQNDADTLLAVEVTAAAADPSDSPVSAQSGNSQSGNPHSANRGSSSQTRSAELSVDPSVTPTSTAAAKDSSDATVRVPVKQLDQLSDLFSELTIERNGLDLHLRRLRGLLQVLNQRVQVLEQSNTRLRDEYDRMGVRNDSAPVLRGETTLSLVPYQTPPAQGASNAVNHHEASLRDFDSLEMDRYSDVHLMSQEVMETIVQIQEVASDIDLSLEDTEQTARELNKTSRQLRSRMTQVRMRPLSDVLNRFPKALREMSLQYGKPVELVVQGESTLIERNILEALSDPLMHLLRNAFDHGIETPEVRRANGKFEQGTIEIAASHRNNRTIITIRDDGNGIPIDKIRAKARQMGLDETLLAAASDEELLSLIFEPGFSTSDRVTALSGRGVGMDVVRDRLRQIQGEIKVSTQAGLGTTFTLSVPYTLSVTRVLIVESNGMLLAFPTDAIQEMILLQPEQIIRTAGSEAFTWEETMVQLVRLSQWLIFNHPRYRDEMETPPAIAVPTVLLVSQNNQPAGILIDRSWGEQEVAIRKVEGGFPMPPGMTNCTILGDGRIVPLVNLAELLHWIASCERSVVDAPLTPPMLAPTNPRSGSLNLPGAGMTSGILSGLVPGMVAGMIPGMIPGVTGTMSKAQPTVLIVDDSINVRKYLALTLEKAGYTVAQARDGQDALDQLSSGLQVEAVICDIEMPRLDGYSFLARVKSDPHLEQIPIAMLTSRSGNKHRQLARSAFAPIPPTYLVESGIRCVSALVKPSETEPPLFFLNLEQLLSVRSLPATSPPNVHLPHPPYPPPPIGRAPNSDYLSDGERVVCPADSGRAAGDSASAGVWTGGGREPESDSLSKPGDCGAGYSIASF